MEDRQALQRGLVEVEDSMMQGRLPRKEDTQTAFSYVKGNGSGPGF